MKKSHLRGFTLIEILIVIAIIGILTAIIMSSLSQARSKARDAKRISDIVQIQLAFELFYDRCKEYPSTFDVDSYCTVSSVNIPLSTFIAKIPTAPIGTSYFYNPTGSLPFTDYILSVQLENYNEVLKDNAVPGPGNSANCSVTPPYYYCVGPR